MPRQPRKCSTTDYYHVMIRGINKEYLFKNNKHKEKFFDLIKKEEQEGLIKIGAWCIMDNHVHFVLKASLKEMSKAIKIVCLKYAAYYNNASNRIGPVFGDRYKSENIEDDNYMLQVIRYIHNNPLKANIVKNTSDYKWSSFNHFIKQSNFILKEQKDFILRFFDNNISQFIEYHKQVDNNEYIEIKEEQEKFKLEVGQKIIEDFFEDKGIISEKELASNPEWKDELVVKLKSNSHLTLRQIAKLTGLSLNIVHKISIR